jgi:hypothetical protein
MAEKEVTVVEGFSWKQFLTKKRYVPKWLKRGLAIIVVLLITGWLIWSYFFSLQVNTLAILRINNEDLSIVPQPLADRTIGPSYGSFDAFGYTFQLPWQDANRLNNLKYTFVARSSVGDAIILADPSTSTDLSTLVKKNPNAFRSIFSSGETISPYAFLRQALFTRPQDISFFVSRRHALRTCMLVRFKWAELATDVREIEAIDTPYVRGFEYKKKDGVTLKLFDTSDRFLDIRFANSRSPIPQSEINAFIFSLRPTSEESHGSPQPN